MSSEKLYFRVPYHKGHAHFYDTIESFPGLHAGPSFEDKEKYIRDTIKYQLLTTTPDQAKRSKLCIIQSSHFASVSVCPNVLTSNSVSIKSYQALRLDKQPKNLDFVND